MTESIDDLLAKVASERQVTPLAHALDVKVADADDLLRHVAQQGFFDEMARYGFQPRSKEAAERMLEVANLLADQLENDTTDETDEIFKAASETLHRSIGNQSPEAQAQFAASFDDSGLKTAQYVADPTVAKLLLARHDARTLLQQ